MAEDDIYRNKEKYERFKEDIPTKYVEPPQGKRIYQIKYKPNVRHFEKLFIILETRDLSYIGMMKYGKFLLTFCHYTDKDLTELSRDDVNQSVVGCYRHYKTPRSRSRFVKGIRLIWKMLCPEKDALGREDETIFPYPVRHLEYRIDRSEKSLPKDLVEPKDIVSLFRTMAHDPRMQALLALLYYSYSRPQETLLRKIGEVDLRDKYGTITISNRGKEGPRFIWVIDAYYYLSRWLNLHPFKDDPEAYIFINTGTRRKHERMTNEAANKQLREACLRIGLQKRLTLYSMKRNGITHSQWKGEAPSTTQHKAGWTSLKQLQTYDLSTSRHMFDLELAKKGIIAEEAQVKFDIPSTKQCFFCHADNGFAEDACINCLRPLDRKKIRQQINEETEAQGDLKKQVQEMESKVTAIQETEQNRSRHDDLLDRLSTMPEFQALVQKVMHKSG